MMKKAGAAFKSTFFGKIKKSPEQNMSCFIICNSQHLFISF